MRVVSATSAAIAIEIAERDDALEKIRHGFVAERIIVLTDHFPGHDGAAAEVGKVVEAMSAAAKTGQIGDGKIFVAPIDQAMRIRTGETDTDAL